MYPETRKDMYLSFFFDYRPLHCGYYRRWRLKQYIMPVWMTLSIHYYKFHFSPYSLWYRFLYNLTSLCSIHYLLFLSIFVVYYRITKLFTPSTPLASLSTYPPPPIITPFLYSRSALCVPSFTKNLVYSPPIVSSFVRNKWRTENV
jgi:hypothetical protein